MQTSYSISTSPSAIEVPDTVVVPKDGQPPPVFIEGIISTPITSDGERELPHPAPNRLSVYVLGEAECETPENRVFLLRTETFALSSDQHRVKGNGAQ